MSESIIVPGILTDGSRPVPRSKAALECDNQRLDYGELAGHVRALSARLAAQGVGAGSRVALAAQRDVDTYAAMLAVLALGGAYVPLDLAYPSARLVTMLKSAHVDRVVGSESALSSLPAHGIPLMALDVDVDAQSAAKPAEVGYDELAYILFTSGSTGVPKGVAMPRGPLARLMGWHQRQPRLRRAARTLAFAPMSFDVHCQELHSTLATGGTLVLIDEVTRRDPIRLLKALEQHHIERLFLPYVALQMLAKAARQTGRLPSALKDVISAGENLRITPAIRALFHSLPDARLHNHYGPTETHVATTIQLDPEPESWPDLAPIGKPLPHVKLALRKPDALAKPTEEEGELLIGGDCLADGYLGQLELTARNFLHDPPGLSGRWYATGDLARRGVDGNWYCLGRLDAQTKVDGFRIEPAELEVALSGLSDVQAAAVDVRDLPVLGKQLVAWVVPKARLDDNAWVDTLRSRLRQALPDYLQPARIHVIEEIPRTPSGKIDPRALIVSDTAIAETGATDSLTRVTRAWSRLLGRAEIDPDANVFDLGARSLSVVRLLALLEAEGGKGLEVADVYGAPTARGQAARLDRKDDAIEQPGGLDAAARRGARQRAAFARPRGSHV
jgi:amino acid adenylation domain-containing protein